MAVSSDRAYKNQSTERRDVAQSLQLATEGPRGQLTSGVIADLLYTYTCVTHSLDGTTYKQGIAS